MGLLSTAVTCSQHVRGAKEKAEKIRHVVAANINPLLQRYKQRCTAWQRCLRLQHQDETANGAAPVHTLWSRGHIRTAANTHHLLVAVEHCDLAIGVNVDDD